MTVADQMGTSVKMLERYYNKNRTRRHADLLSGAAEIIEAAVQRHRPSMEEELDAEEVGALVPWDRDIEEHEERAAGCGTRCGRSGGKFPRTTAPGHPLA
jgi:hypothetical protein